MPHTEVKTEAQAQKELIAKLKLRFEFRGSAFTWGRTSNEFHIYFGRFTTPFSFYGSVVDYDNNVKTLSDSELLNAYRRIISDAYCTEEATNKDDFLEMFGYLDSEYSGLRESELEYTLSQDDFARFESGVTAWNGCKSAHKRLNKNADELCDILETLSEIGVE